MNTETPDNQSKPPITKDNADMVGIVYILYLASVVMGVTAIIGLIMAYVYRGESPNWMVSHYNYQIHTFWKGLVFFVVGVILIPVIIGLLILLCLFVWWIIRNAKGLRAMQARKPIADPTAWGI